MVSKAKEQPVSIKAKRAAKAFEKVSSSLNITMKKEMNSEVVVPPTDKQLTDGFGQ